MRIRDLSNPLFVNMLLHLYAVHVWGQNSKSDPEAPRANGMPNLHANGHIRTDSRARDAEEFELEGLISEDDDAEPPVESKVRQGLMSQH